ncbi:hypothetical protein BDN70DRAFT_925312 [Pholiota conissans]|uniref:Uncharacterized protein n=1 Tax=Pholiota conissans TaxID=109636 RepID=A0A9P5YPR7_9AGAR|nr:hypothetical protein BDN70DRAFT_925312 [Pholiota conissans]
MIDERTSQQHASVQIRMDDIGIPISSNLVAMSDAHFGRGRPGWNGRGGLGSGMELVLVNACMRRWQCESRIRNLDLWMEEEAKRGVMTETQGRRAGGRREAKPYLGTLAGHQRVALHNTHYVCTSSKTITGQLLASTTRPFFETTRWVTWRWECEGEASKGRWDGGRGADKDGIEGDGIQKLKSRREECEDGGAREKGCGWYGKGGHFAEQKEEGGGASLHTIELADRMRGRYRGFDAMTHGGDNVDLDLCDVDGVCAVVDRQDCV